MERRPATVPVAQVRIRRAAEDGLVQRRLAELLVGRVAQRVLDGVDRVAAHALEVVLVERGLQEGVGEQLEVGVEIVAVHAARQRAALEVDAHVVARGERVERRQDLVERARLGRRVDEHLARRGNARPSLPGGSFCEPTANCSENEIVGSAGDVEQYHGESSGSVTAGGALGGVQLALKIASAAAPMPAARLIGRGRSTPTVRRSARR